MSFIKNTRMPNIQQAAFIYLSLNNNDATSIGKLRFFIQKLMRRPKLGLEYLCAALDKKRIKARIYDQTLDDFTYKDLSDMLMKDEINLIGLYTCSENIKNAISFLRHIKKTLSVPIIAGGPGCIHYKELLLAGCDIICLGEGDDTIVDIIDYYESRKRLEEIKGIAYIDRTSYKINTTQARPLIDNLDKLPFPLRSPETVKKYYDHFAYPLSRPYISIACSRGCPYRCAFCASSYIWQGRYRQRSVENVINEIKEAVVKFRIKSICFTDDVFAQNFNWLKEFCNSLDRERFRLKWMCDLNPNDLRSRREEAFSMMAEAGCKLISFGGQSANAEVLKNINRNPHEIEELKRSIHIAKKMNITTVVNYIFGLPGDTKETLEENLEFCLDAKPHMVDFHPLAILPNSEIAHQYKDRSFCKLNETEIMQLCKKYMIEYYRRPEVAGQLLKDIFAKNPGWFFSNIRVIPALLETLSPNA